MLCRPNHAGNVAVSCSSFMKLLLHFCKFLVNANFSLATKYILSEQKYYYYNRFIAPWTFSGTTLQMAARSLCVLLHKYTIISPLVTIGLPISTPKIALPAGRSPPLCTCLILGPSWPTTPNGIQIQSPIFSQFTGQTDRLTERHTKWQVVQVTKPAYAVLII